MDCNNAFKQLKHILLYASILAMPDFDSNFVVETYSSDVAVGSVLVHHN